MEKHNDKIGMSVSEKDDKFNIIDGKLNNYSLDLNRSNIHKLNKCFNSLNINLFKILFEYLGFQKIKILLINKKLRKIIFSDEIFNHIKYILMLKNINAELKICFQELLNKIKIKTSSNCDDRDDKKQSYVNNTILDIISSTKDPSLLMTNQVYDNNRYYVTHKHVKCYKYNKIEHNVIFNYNKLINKDDANEFISQLYYPFMHIKINSSSNLLSILTSSNLTANLYLDINSWIFIKEVLTYSKLFSNSIISLNINSFESEIIDDLLNIIAFNLSSLEIIAFNFNSLTKDDFRYILDILKCCKNLKRVYFIYSFIKDTILELFKSNNTIGNNHEKKLILNKLGVIDFENSFSTLEFFEILLSKNNKYIFPNVKSLFVYFNKNSIKTILSKLTYIFPNLFSITLYYIDFLIKKEKFFILTKFVLLSKYILLISDEVVIEYILGLISSLCQVNSLLEGDSESLNLFMEKLNSSKVVNNFSRLKYSSKFEYIKGLFKEKFVKIKQITFLQNDYEEVFMLLNEYPSINSIAISSISYFENIDLLFKLKKIVILNDDEYKFLLFFLENYKMFTELLYLEIVNTKLSNQLAIETSRIFEADLKHVFFIMNTKNDIFNKYF